MLILILTLMLVTEPTVLTCKVVDHETVQCTKGSEQLLITPLDWNHDAFSEWWLQSNGPNAEPRRVKPAIGQTLKIGLGEDGQWYALASCEVRIHRRVHEWSKNHPGERVPFVMWTPPEDCQEKR